MKHEIKHFKTPHIALKELEPFIKDGKLLQTGRPLKNFGGMLPREVLANWLICVAVDEETLTFTTDTDLTKGDGIILNKDTGEAYPTEHVMVSPSQPIIPYTHAPDTETLILNAINRKRNKGGSTYPSGKILIVFREKYNNKKWHPNKMAKHLPQPLYFIEVWVVGLERAYKGKYIYSVTKLDLTQGNAPIWLIQISDDFCSWKVRKTQ